MGLFGLVLVLLFASRACFIFPMLYAHNRWGEEALTPREIIVAWCEHHAWGSGAVMCCCGEGGREVFEAGRVREKREREREREREKTETETKRRR
jgi:hypothetical protein